MRRHAATVALVLTIAIGIDTRTQGAGSANGTPGTPVAIPTCGWRSPGPCVIPPATLTAGAILHTSATASVAPTPPGCGPLSSTSDCVETLDYYFAVNATATARAEPEE